MSPRQPPAQIRPTNLFLLADREIVRWGLRAVIAPEDDLVIADEAARGEDALRKLPKVLPDVVLVDLRDDATIDICRAIHVRCPETHCIVLTSREDRSELATAARAGEATFVSREVTGAELAELIRAVGHGGRPAGPILAEPLGSVGPEQHEDELRWLTFQERRILSGIGEGLTNREISERMFLAEKTVKNYASNLLVKLGMRHRAQAAALFARLDERHHLAH